MELAIALHQSPRLNRRVQEIGVPADVLDVIRIASGDSDQLCRAQEETGLDSATLKEAAVLYVQQALFFDGADSYRTLGLESDAPQEQLKEHHRWLIHWLHPDRCGDNEFGVFAERVNKAWNELRTPARREQYDQQLASARQVHRETPVPAAAGMSHPSNRWSGDRFSSAAVTTSNQRLRLVIVIVLGFCSLVALVRWFEANEDRPEQQPALAETTKGSSAVAPDAKLKQDTNDALAQTQEPSRNEPAHESNLESQNAVSAAADASKTTALPAQDSFIPADAERSAAGDAHDSVNPVRTDRSDATPMSAKEANAVTSVATPVHSTAGVVTSAATTARFTADVRKSSSRSGATQVQGASTAGALLPVQAVDADKGKAAPSAGAQTADLKNSEPLSHSTPQEPTSAASTAQVASLERTSSAPSIDEAKAILKQLAGAYRAGDLAALMLLFVEEPQGMSRAALYKQYKNLFTDSRERTLSVQIAGWITERNTLVALGQYQTQLLSRSGNQPRTETGMVRIEMRTENGQVRIVRLAHSQSKG
jgi:curved DNA-binding protein CbpA